MSAYVISMMAVHDPDIYRRYTDLTPPTVKKYGGKFLTRGEPVCTFEGEENKDRMVILEFPGKSHIEEWMANPNYQEAMKFRMASSTMRMLLVQEGNNNTEDQNPHL
jgi:uncharacterized protein (DUF1330 family)